MFIIDLAAILLSALVLYVLWDLSDGTYVHRSFYTLIKGAGKHCKTLRF